MPRINPSKAHVVTPHTGDTTPVKDSGKTKKTPGLTGLDAATAAGTVPTSGVDATLTHAGIDAGTLNAGVRDLFGVASNVDTVQTPTRPSIQKLYDDPRFKKLYELVTGRLRTLQNENRGWDKLWQVRNFVEALNLVTGGSTPLMDDLQGPQERRAVAHLLLLTMPEEWRTERPVYPDGSRGAPQSLFEPFPDEVIARADNDFALRPGDLPKTAPIFTRHLTSPDFLERVFRPGQHGTFLASKKYCPGAFLQDRRDINPPGKSKKEQVGHEGDPIFVKVDDVVVKDGRKYAKCHVEPQYKTWLDGGGNIVRGEQVFAGTNVVLDTQGKPVLGPDGQPQPILIPVDHMADYLLDPGRNTAGLDMSREDDRALALTYTHGLKTTYLTDSNGITKSLFGWLQEADERTPRRDLERIKQEVRHVAWQTVARHASHPRRTHFKLNLDGGGWQREAYDMLRNTGIMQDCGNRYEKDKSNTSGMHEMAWTSAFLGRGFVGGSLDCYGLARAYDRLSATFLAPLGIISKTDLAEGHGSELNRVLSQPDDNGVIQVGEPMKSKLNEMIVGLDAQLSSGRGPAAEYMENWPGYLKIAGPTGGRYDFARANATLHALEDDYARA